MDSRQPLFGNLKWGMGLVVILLACTLPLKAWAAFTTVSIEGARQGPIQGDNTARGQEGTIIALALTSSIAAPLDPATGLISGRPQAGPLGIVKNFERSTPKLFQALVTGELLNRVVIRFYTQDAAGVLRNNFTIELRDAFIQSIDTGGNAQVASGVRETVNFVYRRIKLRDEINGVESDYDFNARI